MQRKKYRKLVTMLALIVMSISSISTGTMLSFAETLPENQAEEVVAIENEEQDAAKEKTEETVNTGIVEKKEESKQQSVKSTDGTMTVPLSAKGNGSFNFKLSKNPDEMIKEVYPGQTANAAANKGETFEITTYALDGNKTNVDLQDAEITNEIAFGNNCKLMYEFANILFNLFSHLYCMVCYYANLGKWDRFYYLYFQENVGIK